MIRSLSILALLLGLQASLAAQTFSAQPSFGSGMKTERPDVAYDADAGRYLVVARRDLGFGQATIVARLFQDDGTQLGRRSPSAILLRCRAIIPPSPSTASVSRVSIATASSGRRAWGAPSAS